MNRFLNTSICITIILCFTFILNSCSVKNKKQTTTINTGNTVTAKVPNDVIPFFQHWNLILGDGTNAGPATDFEHKDFFYTTNDGAKDWVVFKTPNAGNTHGTSNNTRTELAQLKKWPAMSEAKLSATLKVMNVATTGDATVPATYSAVIGQY